MERRKYRYDPVFSEETNNNLKVFHEIYEDCRLILNAEKHTEWVTGKVSAQPTDEIMNEYHEYLKGYIGEENRGILRTLLIIGKPYKLNPIVKDTLGILASRLRKDSPTRII